MTHTPSSFQPDLELLRPATTRVCGEIETLAEAEGWGPIIGLDEAGRGPLAGPVVAAGCALGPDVWREAARLGLDDSKKMTEKARDRLFDWIEAHAVAFAVAVIEPAVIDQMNILRASLHGMAVSWQAIVDAHAELSAARVLVDGRDRAPLPHETRQVPLIKGDSRSLNIAAASVLAKVTRDRIMTTAHETWPVYGFAKHKGYPTLAHRQAIAQHGPCPIHRLSFTLLANDDRKAPAKRKTQGP